MTKKTSDIKLILSIDTSCDETSAALTYENQVLSNVLASQAKLHHKWGGTVPALARREHEKNIDWVVAEALARGLTKFGVKTSKRKILNDIGAFVRAMKSVDAVAVTHGPGLAIALEIGVRKAKELALEFDKPLIKVNHMEGHLFSGLAVPFGKEKNTLQSRLFPSLGVLVSGGHTELVLVKNFGEYEIIGQTVDDAMGEAFDKVAMILNLGYPGGPIISKLAEDGDPQAFDLPVPMKGSGDLNVSFSGLKTAVLYLVRDLRGESRVQEAKKGVTWTPEMEEKGISQTKYANEKPLSAKIMRDLAASFQAAAIETIVNKVEKALKKYEFKSVLMGGGVVNNLELRKRMREVVENEQLFLPYNKKLYMDNAAMIGVAAYLRLRNPKSYVLDSTKDIQSLDRDPGLRL